PKRKKGRLNDKRPKSREETPKEGSDSARRYRTATICGRAAQNARVFEGFPALSRQGWRFCNSRLKPSFFNSFRYLVQPLLLRKTCRSAMFRGHPAFVIDGAIENSAQTESDSKALKA
ncbi:MAG: hypothetical protein PS018_12405, partial [bacterium]|nr:hypothetical protein [bacterium]